jgi:hypothetical protein
MKNFTEEELSIIARWNGEAAKEWWSSGNDSIREEIEKLPPNQIFALGWSSYRASDFRKKEQ